MLLRKEGKFREKHKGKKEKREKQNQSDLGVGSDFKESKKCPELNVHKLL